LQEKSLYLTVFKYIYYDNLREESRKFIRKVMGHSMSTYKANYMEPE